jgi:hypothetical protein
MVGLVAGSSPAEWSHSRLLIAAAQQKDYEQDGQEQQVGALRLVATCSIVSRYYTRLGGRGTIGRWP